jgi:PAS domain-containing protein
MSRAAAPESMARQLPILAVALFAALPAAAQDENATEAASAVLATVAAAALLLAGWLGTRLRRLAERMRGLTARNARLAATCQALRETAERAEGKLRMLDGVMAAMSDGIAVVDGELRLVSWNPRFPEIAGVPRRALRIGMPFAEVIRLQAEAGEFGLVDPEAEAARRMQALREGRILERWQRERPDGSRIELRRAPLPGGGFVTLYSPLADPAGLPQPDLADAFRAEWAARLPRLTAAAADGDLPGVRAAAHALRGIAANAGWAGAAAALATLEVAAEAGELPEVRGLAAMLVADDPW